MKIIEKLQKNFSKKKKGNMFLLILSFIITLFTSLTINNATLQARIANLYYLDYPQNFAVYNLLHENDYKKFMNDNFTGLDYEVFYCKSERQNVTTNIVADDLSVQVIGCKTNFENFPVPSAYSNSIVETSIIEGESFSDADLISNSNAMIMYYSHLDKINYQSGQQIIINGQKYSLKGVLKDNSDVKRNIGDNVIQIFIPYTSFLNYFRAPTLKTVMRSDNYSFPSFQDDNNFLSYEKVCKIIDRSYNYSNQSSLISIVSTFAISFIATIILQILLIRSRYNEIGIRRAVGANRDSLIFMFTMESIQFLFFGILLGAISFSVIYSTLCLILSNIYFSSIFVINLAGTVISALIYFCICFISVFVPSAIGTNINIASILVEEK